MRAPWHDEMSKVTSDKKKERGENLVGQTQKRSNLAQKMNEPTAAIKLARKRKFCFSSILSNTKDTERVNGKEPTIQSFKSSSFLFNQKLPMLI